MRVEPFGVGSIVHVVQRGTRGIPIVRDARDRRRFERSLYYLNDKHSDSNWHRITSEETFPARPAAWPERTPLVKILGLTLLTNHFHLILNEYEEGGIAKFMQRLCGSMTKCYNAKYGGQGSLFQGSYKARTVTSDSQLNYLAFYVLVKNVLDLYPGGLVAAERNFDDAWKWALQYQHSSLPSFIGQTTSPIIEDDELLLAGIMTDAATYKNEAHELLTFHLAAKGGDLAPVTLEVW